MTAYSPTTRTGLRAAGSAAEPMDPDRFTVEHARHLLLRAGFGGSPRRISELWAMGLDDAVDSLVDYEAIADPLPPHGIAPTAGPDRAGLAHLSDEQRRAQNDMRRRQDRQKFQQLRSWWMERMLRSPRPLEEKMTLFWHGHFTSAYRDVRDAHRMAQQNELLRRNATGSFARLVHMICRDPAMLRYLNNDQNHRRSPNENFARELLELFTLGEGHYTETDVKEAARAFTGWTFTPVNSRFRFARRNHDFGSKEFLGRTGTFKGDDIVQIALEQAAAPRHVAARILSFLAVEPSAEETEPYADLLRNDRYELKPLLRTLFKSAWFYSGAVLARQVKSPVMFVLSTLKAMDVDGVDGAYLVRNAASIGQEIMQPPSVKGWDGGAAWITSGNLMGRYDIARELISPPPRRARRDRMPPASDRRDAQVVRRFSPYQAVREAGISAPDEILSLFEKRFLATGLAGQRRRALIDFLSGADRTPPLDLGDPRRAEHKLSELLHLLATAPEFQLC